MKLRTLLILSNLLSLSIILIFLIVSYIQMSIPVNTIFALIGITFVAGIFSFLIHLGLTSPVLKAVKQMIRDSKQIAAGNFQSKVSAAGPREIKELAVHFNEMSGKLNELFMELKRSENFKTELIANISHDLRTPISSILSFAEALEDGVVEDEASRKEYLSIIKRETARLSKLIDELLELSRLDERSLPYDPVSSHADELVLRSLEQFEIKLKEKKLKMNVHIDDGLQTLQIVPEAIIRVLTNLMQNAIRHSPPEANLFISVTEESACIRFSIRDEGPGIDAAEINRIFDRFYRIEKSRNQEHGGSGLGLAISKEIVHRHGGEIGVDSIPGKGSDFWFTIPVNS